MASIRGVSIEHYVESETDRGIYFMGSILLEGQKIGTFENEGEGGGTEFYFDSKDAEFEFARLIEHYFQDNPASLDNMEGFILELLDLMEAEREFIKRTQRYSSPFILVQANTYSRTSTFEDITEIASSYYSLHNENELMALQNQINAVEYNIYRNLNDFIK